MEQRFQWPHTTKNTDFEELLRKGTKQTLLQQAALINPEGREYSRVATF